MNTAFRSMAAAAIITLFAAVPLLSPSRTDQRNDVRRHDRADREIFAGNQGSRSIRGCYVGNILHKEESLSDLNFDEMAQNLWDSFGQFSEDGNAHSSQRRGVIG